MNEEIEHQVKETKKALLELRKKMDVLRFKPCRGDRELRQKDEALEELQKEIQNLNKKAAQLEKQLREAKYGVVRRPE
jgi:predicted RNase H-like nuclease (RuvC/YqgF family)